MRPRITPQGVLDAEVASTFYLRIVYKVLSIARLTPGESRPWQ